MNNKDIEAYELRRLKYKPALFEDTLLVSTNQEQIFMKSSYIDNSGFPTD